MRGVRRFIDLRAWQACDTYKKAIYKLIDAGVYGNDWKRRARERRIASRPERLAKRTAKKESEPGTTNPEPRTTNPEQRTEPEHEPRSENPEE